MFESEARVNEKRKTRVMCVCVCVCIEDVSKLYVNTVEESIDEEN